MKQSKMFVPTMRDIPADAEIASHRLMLRAGYMRQSASGVYSYLPLAKRALQKIETIIREEMENTAHGSELLMPALQPAELWQESRRWYTYGPELMRLKDRHGRDFALGATHEEVITDLLRDEVNSYKKMPLVLYQIQTKFRDEKRPRFGLLRGREFIMKDAYSFHSSFESLDESYEDLFKAYSNVFSRCGLNFRAVIADSGAMGGKDTHEFMVLSDVGEDTIAYSDTSDYAANIEMAEVNAEYGKSDETPASLQKTTTEDAKTIEEVANYLNVGQSTLIKSILARVDDEFFLLLVRGDHDINEIKVKNLLDASIVGLASPEETREVMGCDAGAVGPVGVPDKVKVIADYAVETIVNGVCGANENGYHYLNANAGRDFKVDQYADLRFIQEGDRSPDGKGTIRFARGIEVGHIFKLGTVYSEKMKALFLDENGKTSPFIMGCYGIGVSRLLASVVEQHHDDDGIVWPKAISPFDVHLIPVNVKNDEQRSLADKLYQSLGDEGIDVLYDDRKERPGVKFADADLFGFPLRITVGKKASEGIVEVKNRSTGEVTETSADDASATVKEMLQNYQ
ncbi:proline--tRNA ligase [Bacillus marinisedimentorum]|uniref:proline--tRNA ligase n=1 Tax=Bacillus marinisedimentorum TaxID=1821260 RepID=UPI0007E1918F|nr:proline--tRNA ligase [Bacillus marinisedimentorum]